MKRLNPTNLSLSAALLLAASGCGPTPESAQAPETLASAQRTDGLGVDECATGTHSCSINATCTNTDSGYTCACNEDFAGDGQSCTRVSYTVALEPVADAKVRAANPDTNFGTSDEFAVSPAWYGSTYLHEEAYLRFDLGSLPANARVKSAKLQTTAYTGWAWGGDGNVYTHLVTDDAWSETGLTWNNRPAISGSSLGYWWLWYDNRYVDLLGINADPALATTVRSELAGDKKLSVRLSSPGYRTNYRSREYANANQRPKLFVTYDLVTVLEPVADAKVRYSEPNTNFGTSTEFAVSPAWYGSLYMLEESYLRFDLSGIPAHARVSSAKLSATAYTGYAWGGDGNVYTHLVMDDAWSETGLTWNNKPASSGGSLGYWWLWYDGSHVDQVGVNTDPALATAVQSEVSGDQKLSVRLSSPGYRTNYRSREYANANQRPRLEVSYVEACMASEDPTLVVNGSLEMTLECGVDTWVDPGARAWDSCGDVEVHRYNSGSDAYGPGPIASAEGSYDVQYIAWNQAGYTVDAVRTVHVEDRLPPTLKLKGAASMVHQCGSQFVDPGVESMDACYGNVAPTVTQTGYVNGWEEGVYTVRYDVRDSGGNSAPSVTRTVQVVDCPW